MEIWVHSVAQRMHSLKRQNQGVLNTSDFQVLEICVLEICVVSEIQLLEKHWNFGGV